MLLKLVSDSRSRGGYVQRVLGVVPPERSIERSKEKVIAFLKPYYYGGRMLMESYGNEYVSFAVPPNRANL